MIPPPHAAIGYVQYVHAAATAPGFAPSTQQAPAGSTAYSNTVTGDWFGLRTGLANQGIGFNGYGVNDNSWNLFGGKSTHDFVSRARLTLEMNLDTDKLFGWAGGTVVSSVRFHFGLNGNDIQLGSLQGFSYIDDAPPATQLYELYYRQTVISHKLTLQAGRIDVNNIFDIPVDATDFVNPSASDAPLTLQNAPPSQAPGLAVFVKAIPGNTLIFGAFFNGRSHPTALDAMLNTLATIEEPDGTSLNIELDQNYNLATNMPGTMGIGAFAAPDNYRCWLVGVNPGRAANGHLWIRRYGRRRRRISVWRHGATSRAMIPMSAKSTIPFKPDCWARELFRAAPTIKSLSVLIGPI